MKPLFISVIEIPNTQTYTPKYIAQNTKMPFTAQYNNTILTVVDGKKLNARLTWNTTVGSTIHYFTILQWMTLIHINHNIHIIAWAFFFDIIWPFDNCISPKKRFKFAGVFVDYMLLKKPIKSKLNFILYCVYLRTFLIIFSGKPNPDV